jgi:hypothetical protein
VTVDFEIVTSPIEESVAPPMPAVQDLPVDVTIKFEIVTFSTVEDIWTPVLAP